MTSSVSSLDASIAAVEAARAAKNGPPSAAKTMNLLMQSDDFVGAITAQSNYYIPVGSAQLADTLWAMFDTTGAKSITLDDVSKAVNAEGGTRQDAAALWAQMDPNNTGKVDALDFVSGFIAFGIQQGMPAVQDAVTSAILKQGPTTDNNVLSMFISNNSDSNLGTIFSVFA